MNGNYYRVFVGFFFLELLLLLLALFDVCVVCMWFFSFSSSHSPGKSIKIQSEHCASFCFKYSYNIEMFSLRIAFACARCSSYCHILFYWFYFDFYCDSLVCLSSSYSNILMFFFLNFSKISWHICTLTNTHTHIFVAIIDRMSTAPSEKSTQAITNIVENGRQIRSTV